MTLLRNKKSGNYDYVIYTIDVDGATCYVVEKCNNLFDDSYTAMTVIVEDGTVELSAYNESGREVWPGMSVLVKTMANFIHKVADSTYDYINVGGPLPSTITHTAQPNITPTYSSTEDKEDTIYLTINSLGQTMNAFSKIEHARKEKKLNPHVHNIMALKIDM